MLNQISINIPNNIGNVHVLKYPLNNNILFENIVMKRIYPLDNNAIHKLKNNVYPTTICDSFILYIIYIHINYYKT